MADTQQASDTADELLEARENRRRIARFVVIFVVTTLLLLTSYRFAIHTRLNDWYLFQAAGHTTWALSRIGSAELEPHHYGRQDARELRATLQAWREGRDSANAEDIESASPRATTAWERWSYRAIEMRRSETPRMNGPRVYFVLRQGVSTRIDAVVGDINRIEETGDSVDTTRTTELNALRSELEALRREQQELRASGDSGTSDTSLIFPFILIPECGAIEIMAIFLAAVLAFPTSWGRRLVGILAGLPIMYLVNIFRLTVLAVIGAMDKSRVWFNFAHEYVWQAIYIIFVVAVWLLWVEYVVKRRRT